jgi:hypothetical protein
VELSWTAAKNATRYQVLYSFKKNGTYKKATKEEYISGSVAGKWRKCVLAYPKNKKVFFRVIPYNDSTKGSASDWVSVKVANEKGNASKVNIKNYNKTVYVGATSNKFTGKANRGVSKKVRWVSDNTKINYFVPGDDLMVVDYCSGYAPEAGGLLYWYNIPEELDIPGEYYIDKNAVLYYYPKDGFENAVISMPLSNGLMNIDGADHLTLERIHFTSSISNGITANGTDYLTIVDCEISSIAGERALSANGNNIQIKGNHIHDCSKGAVSVRTGDQATLTEGNSIVYNNHIHDWGIFYYPYADAISGGGCGLLISHNEIHSSNASATSCGGAKVIIESEESEQ